MEINEKMIVQLTLGELRIAIADEVKKALEDIRPVQSETKEEEFWTRERCAKALNISLPTLSALSKEGVIISYQLGGRVLYKPAEVAMALTKVKPRK